jgi:tRNA(Ile)-lysidine synthase
MSDPITLVYRFLQAHCQSSQPLLLALSGGADSLCLFYCLLKCQRQLAFSFHVAHVNHGWRQESQFEAIELEKLCQKYQIPFHYRTLDPTLFKGNLEEACREERYRFFKELTNIYLFQGILLGHQADDQAETILKRLLEGAHWSTLSALTPLSYREEMRLLRPFLAISKKMIRAWLEKQQVVPFEDYTNEDPRFLRARMRQTLIPLLSQEFGKEIQRPLTLIGEEIQELKTYFDAKLDPLLAQIVKGPWGPYLDLTHCLPSSPLELKYLIRKFCKNEGINLSRPSLELATQLLQNNLANRSLVSGNRQIWIDRQKIFIPYLQFIFEYSIDLLTGTHVIGNWKVDVMPISVPVAPTNWQEGWKGHFMVSLPAKDLREYRLGPSSPSASYHFKNQPLSKWWGDHKIPTFLRPMIPVVWKGNTVYHEFLTGYMGDKPSCQQNWVAVKVSFSV